MVQRWGDRQSKSGQRTCRGPGGGNRLLTSPSFTLQSGGNTGRGSPPSGTTLTEALVGRAKVPIPLQESGRNLDIRCLSCLQYPFAFHALCPSHYFSNHFLDAEKSWVVQVALDSSKGREVQVDIDPSKDISKPYSIRTFPSASTLTVTLLEENQKVDPTKITIWKPKRFFILPPFSRHSVSGLILLHL